MMIKSRYLSEPLSAYASEVTIPPERIGEISDDRSAVIGHADWCFIYEGSNNYRGSYSNQDLSALGISWAHVIEARQKYCLDLGIQFLQVIVPNKASLLFEFFPETLMSDVTYPLKGLLSSGVNANLLVPIDAFRGDSVRESVFRRNDSHLTVAGNAYLSDLIVAKLGLIHEPCEVVATQETEHIGDLGVKFRLQFSEKCSVPRWNEGLLDQSNFEKLSDISTSGFVGTEQSFNNRRAGLKKKILVIGNSFFERVPSWGASPFFAALFESFNFYWASNVDSKVIERVMPDILIAQTCERFLSVVPNDNLGVSNRMGSLI